MGRVLQMDRQLGWVPAIPEPFWYRGWRTFFRWRPQCVECYAHPIFANRADWERHYVLTHMEPLP